MENMELFDVEPQGADWCDSTYCTKIFCAPYTYSRKCYDPIQEKYLVYCNCPSYTNSSSPA